MWYGNLSLTMDPEDIESHLEKHVAKVSAEMSGKLKYMTLNCRDILGKWKIFLNKNGDKLLFNKTVANRYYLLF